MARTDIATATEITTAHKISVGLVVATALFVGLSALAAAIYTLTVNAASSSTPAAVVPLQPASDASVLDQPVDVKNDNVLTTP